MNNSEIIRSISKSLILIFACFLSFSQPNLIAQSQASVNIKFTHFPGDTIKKNINGGFIELLLDYTNGFMGMWAQELKDRGLDYPENGFLGFWEKVVKNSNTDEIRLETGGYNENGQYYVSLKSKSQYFTGIKQSLYLSDTCAHKLYFYSKKPTKEGYGSILIRIYDYDTNKELYNQSLLLFNSDWEKFEVDIPITKGLAHCNFAIGTGDSIDIDELSLMPANNVFGLRSEYAKYFDYWKPAVMRYPGGWFADSKISKWKNCLLPIDKRYSPGILNSKDNMQRMDMAFDEFMTICNHYNISPQIVVNVENGTAQEAAEWVEYANGDTNSAYGKIRAKNGNPKPYNIKYWEIGNEQWTAPIEYANKFVEFYDSMKLVDKSIYTIIDGNNWEDNSFDNLMNVVGGKCDIWGYHPAKGFDNSKAGTDLQKYLAMVGYDYFKEKKQDYANKIAKSQNPKMLQAITEWWTSYGSSSDWLLDTNSRNRTLESGLVNALMTMSYYSYPNNIEFASRTIGIGLFGRAIDKENKKIFFAYPSLYSMAILRNHIGHYLYTNEVNCETYKQDFLPLWTPETKWLEVMTTGNVDSLYIAIVNRHPSDEMETTLTIPGVNFSINGCKAYELSSNNYLDCNQPDSPLTVIPKEKSFTFNGKYKFPKHSLTVLAIPAKDINDVSSDIEQTGSLKIYPNPAKDEIAITNLDNETNIEYVKVFSALGECLSTYINDSALKDVKLNISNLTSGVYFLEIKTGSKTLNTKIVKY